MAGRQKSDSPLGELQLGLLYKEAVVSNLPARSSEAAASPVRASGLYSVSRTSNAQCAGLLGSKRQSRSNSKHCWPWILVTPGAELDAKNGSHFSRSERQGSCRRAHRQPWQIQDSNPGRFTLYLAFSITHYTHTHTLLNKILTKQTPALNGNTQEGWTVNLYPRNVDGTQPPGVCLWKTSHQNLIGEMW